MSTKTTPELSARPDFTRWIASHPTRGSRGGSIRPYDEPSLWITPRNLQIVGTHVTAQEFCDRLHLRLTEPLVDRTGLENLNVPKTSGPYVALSTTLLKSATQAPEAFVTYCRLWMSIAARICATTVGKASLEVAHLDNVELLAAIAGVDDSEFERHVDELLGMGVALRSRRGGICLSGSLAALVPGWNGDGLFD